jgi:hypothetical protein
MSFISKVVWILVIVIIFLFVSYLASKIMVGVLNQRLNKIQINIDTSTSKSKNKKDDVETEEGVIESFMGKPKRKYYEMKNNDLCEGFDNSDKGFKPLDPTVFEDRNSICCLDHDKCKAGSTVVCNYGPTNYAYPSDMSPIDKKVFMLNYNDNFTIQDYTNWLKCFKDDKEGLPYNHLKNLNKILKGEQLVYKKGVVPPPTEVQPEMCSEEYFNKLYNSSGNTFVLDVPKNRKKLLGYNYNDFPVFYQNYKQYGTNDRIYNVKDVKNKYSAQLVKNFVEPKLTR